MAQQYHNPFASIDLIVPSEQHNFYHQYCQAGGNTSVDYSPFPRMVDLWFAGLSFAAQKQLKQVNLGRKTVKIIDGSIFDSDNWRIQAIMLVAIAVDENVEIVSEPRRMMAIANGLAAAGVPDIVEMLRDGNQTPIWNLSDSLDEILRER